MDDMDNYDNVWLLCNKTEFAVYRKKDVTEKCCDLVSGKTISSKCSYSILGLLPPKKLH